MANQKQNIRIKVKSYDHKIMDSSIEKIINISKQTGVKVKGPIPLPTKKEIFTVLRATHKYKDSREQFERRTHIRILDVINPNAKTRNMLQNIQLPSGVSVEIKLN